MRKRYILFLLVFAACNPPQERSANSSFFRLKEYFENQAKALNHSGAGLKKTIHKDSHLETGIIKTIDWNKELHPFEEADLNKPAWQKSYKTDTVIKDQQTQLIYTAIEPKLSVRKLEVLLNADTVYQVRIIIEKNNSYYQATQELTYNPGKGYSIRGSQKVILANATTYTIEALLNY
jgi:hypothetical protein